MNNQEIHIRLTAMAAAIPQHAITLIQQNDGKRSVQIELELMNMSLMTIWTMLGEIAKRLPEQK